MSHCQLTKLTLHASFVLVQGMPCHIVSISAQYLMGVGDADGNSDARLTYLCSPLCMLFVCDR
jgi:hypothetical protein